MHQKTFGKRLMSSISVICSVYNSAEWLPRYLEAVNNQFESNIQIVFVEANSTDNSVKLIKDFDFRDGIDVKIIEKEDRITIYAAWNLAIRESSGKYIMNWNTDDLIYPSGIQIYNNYTKKFPQSDFFYSPCFMIGSQNFDNITGLRNWPEYSHEILLHLCFGGPFPLVKKSAIEKCGFFKEEYLSSGDYEMWLNLSSNGFKFTKIPEIVGCFYHRENSVSVKNLSKAQEEDKKIQEFYKRHEH